VATSSAPPSLSSSSGGATRGKASTQKEAAEGGHASALANNVKYLSMMETKSTTTTDGGIAPRAVGPPIGYPGPQVQALFRSWDPTNNPPWEWTNSAAVPPEAEENIIWAGTKGESRKLVNFCVFQIWPAIPSNPNTGTAELQIEFMVTHSICLPCSYLFYQLSTKKCMWLYY
jgi:hypothetical protein